MAEFSVDIRRTIPAARERVFRAFLEPEVLRRWMSPPGYDGADATVEPHVGGRFSVEFVDSLGDRHGLEGVIRELAPGKRIVMDLAFVAYAQNLREGTVVTITFADAPGGTDVRLVQERITLTPPWDPESVNGGWNGTFDKLDAIAEEL